jgi:hypothetical protein
MFRKITSLVAAASFIFLAVFADCMAMSADQQTMECCRHMSCDPANHTGDCCKKMVSAQTLIVLPVTHFPLSAPPAIVAELLPHVYDRQGTQIFRPRVDPPQHSPPLYTLYASFLI